MQLMRTETRSFLDHQIIKIATPFLLHFESIRIARSCGTGRLSASFHFRLVMKSQRGSWVFQRGVSPPWQAHREEVRTDDDAWH